MRLPAVPVAITAALIITACGSAPHHPSHAAHSAATACRDFSDWFLKQGGNILAGNDLALLRQAVSEAPSGTLYRDMNTAEQNVLYVMTQSGTLQTAEKNLTLTGMQQVASDCQSVNPG